MIYETTFANRPLKIETNSLAPQASGSVVVSFGKTVVLGTATLSEKEIEANFVPLTVDYEERFYASGKIKGSRFIRREARPSEEAILVGRMIDRAIRPYFPSNLRKEVQVILTVFAFDEENDPDFPALLAASLSLLTSNIPWEGPIAGVRVGLPISKEGGKENFILNPIYKEREEKKLDLFISGIADKNKEILFNMLEGEGEEVPEEEILTVLEFSKKPIEELLNLQKEIQKKEGKEKFVLEIDTTEIKKIFEKSYDKFKEILLLQKENEKNESVLKKKQLQEELALDDFYFKLLQEKVLHQMVLEENLRPDGRKLDELRKITCQVNPLPRTHGSALFCRGLTHVLSILTLGAPGDELLLEGMEIVGKKRFLHHYNFPPYSTGETKPLRGPGRREIGHGALAEKALRQAIPLIQDFPYTIRIVSEALSSNGSTSMASICASSLALFDAGVPIKNDVAGISMGLILDDEIFLKDLRVISSRDYRILTDIQGPEDSAGDMDLKIAGTIRGINALQLDIKVKGLTIEILKKALFQAKKAREEILVKMREVISSPRKELSCFAPRIFTIKINPEKIREVIGPGGKIINKIIEETDTSIDIEEDGSIFVTAKNEEGGKKAMKWIENITREVKPGEIFQGRVRSIMNFGVFIELLPNQEGLLHISEVFTQLPVPPLRESKLKKIFKIGQIIPVKVKNITEEGKINLSLRKKYFFSQFV